MSKFTPGPWKWLPDKGQFIIDIHWRIVGEVPCQGCNPADGILMAAAPELLEAAKEAREYLLAEGHQEGYNKTLDMICAVIAKAEGSGE